MRPAYLIDGYNLAHAVGTLVGRVGPHGLEQARDKLIAFLAGAFGDDAGCLTVVFDGSRAPPQDEQYQQGVRVLFSARGQEADDLIEDLLASDPHPRHLVVVSDDRRLVEAARRRHAQPMHCADFLDLMEARRRPAAESIPPDPEKTERLSESETQRWIDEFKDLQDDLDRQDPY